MDLLLPWVLLSVVSLGRASCRIVAPQGNSCPAPPVCNLVGNWTSLTGSVQVMAWREGGQLVVKHWTRGLMLQGTARLATTSYHPVFASVVVGSSSTPSLCLQLVLTCFRYMLWVTELPMVGSVPAVSYPLQRHVASAPPSPSAACRKDCRSPERSISHAHNVLVNITLYHNLTTDDVAHDIYGGEAAEDAVGHIKHPKLTFNSDRDQENAFQDVTPVDEAMDGTHVKPLEVQDDPKEETRGGAAGGV